MTSKFVVLPICPAPIPEEKFARSDDVSMGIGLRRVASAYNYVSANQRKQILGQITFPAISPADADENHHLFTFRTGANVDSIEAIVGIRTSALASGTSAAYCEMILEDGTNTLTSSPVYRPAVSTSNYFPQWSKLKITATDHALLPNTEYLGYIRQRHYCVVESLTVYETAKQVAVGSTAGACDPMLWETNKPIYDAGVQNLAECGDALHRYNGSHLFGWTRRSLTTAPNVSSTTPVNLFDTSETAVAANTPGFRLNTQYMNTYNGAVNVVLGVHANRTSGSTGTLTVTLKNSGGTILTRSGILTMSPFDSSTHTISAAAADKVDIHIASSNTDTFRVNSVGIWLYQA